jgi:hypothetical protein
MYATRTCSAKVHMSVWSILDGATSARYDLNLTYVGHSACAVASSISHPTIVAADGRRMAEWHDPLYQQCYGTKASSLLRYQGISFAVLVSLSLSASQTCALASSALTLSIRISAPLYSNWTIPLLLAVLSLLLSCLILLQSRTRYGMAADVHTYAYAVPEIRALSFCGSC